MLFSPVGNKLLATIHSFDINRWNLDDLKSCGQDVHLNLAPAIEAVWLHYS